ncbi:hypothetical protein M9Y10_021756 [Tritrichomonas musculus]|uniref:mRNA m(6)A methyltransferase n=1 Tax=Tritrichomonas musculus TaxID=1915356 RepID=A0ABR2KQF7_9EUKA
MDNDSDSDSYLRKRKPMNYDERDPAINGAEISSDSDALLLINDYYDYDDEDYEYDYDDYNDDDDDDDIIKKRRSRRSDDEQWNLFDDTPDIKDFYYLQRKKFFPDFDEISTTDPLDSNFFTDQIEMDALMYAPAYKNRRRSNDPSIFLDPSGQQCQFIPFNEFEEKMFNSELLFEKCQGFNTLMPEFDPLAKNKLQFFNLESDPSPFDYDYIHSMTDSQIEQILEENNEELKKLSKLSVVRKKKLNKDIIVVPFDDKLTKSVSIKANILYFDWAMLGKAIQFDVVLMDPPWPVTNPKMTRGVEINYDMMQEDDIASMPLHLIQKDGYLFMWVVAKEFSEGLKMMNIWGYEIVNNVNWIKVSRKGRYHPSNGYYIMHSKETLLIGVKGKGVPFMRVDKFNDLIIKPRNLRQSHKPVLLHKIIEDMFPGGKFLEVFARPHNLRQGWISIGNELPG